MKKIVSMMGVAGLLVGVAMTMKAAPVAGIDGSASMGASAEITGATTLTVTPKNVGTNSVATGVSFPNDVGTSNLLANQYLEVAYDSNHASWGVNIYTNYVSSNEVSIPITENLGGLHKLYADGLTASNDALIPLGWQAYKTVALHDADTVKTSPPTELGDNDWTFVKSKKDSNWNDQQNQYAKVLVGVEAHKALIASGPNAGTETASPTFVYLANYAKTKGAGAGTYSATLGMDLYHE